MRIRRRDINWGLWDDDAISKRGIDMVVPLSKRIEYKGVEYNKRLSGKGISIMVPTKKHLC